MQAEKFTAATMAEALQQVKRSLGRDAVILQTRTVERRAWLGLRRREVVEVTAGRGMNVVPRSTPRPSAGPYTAAEQRLHPRSTVGQINDLPLNRQAAAYASAAPLNTHARQPVLRQVVPTGGGVAQAGRALLETPGATNAAMLSMSQELTGLKGMVKDLVSEVRTRSTPQVPEELFDHYLELVKAEVAEELASDIVRSVERSARPEQLSQPDWVRARVMDQLEKLIPTSGPIDRKKATGPHVVALIGPTGVGKTTTVAKLAANLKLREKHKVGLITIDTYRIAAVEQLRRYAELIGVPLHVVGTPEEMQSTIEQMSDCDYILIDTAGRSPKDTLKLNELKRFLDHASPDEVLLVLSSTCGTRSAELIMERFSDVHFDKLILTKVDEAAQLGVVLNVARKINKSLAYVTTGQDVPDDIEVGEGRRLARLILGDR